MATQLHGNVNPGDIFNYDSSIQEFPLGEKVVSSDGRTFRYVLVGGTSLVPGKLYQAPAEITNHQNMTITAASAIGDTTVNFTLGATAATANQYANGYLMVTTTPGQGYSYLIKSHPAADSAAALVVTLSDPIKVALTTSSVVDLVLNPYSGVLVQPTTKTSAVAGLAVNAVTNAQYGWLQTGGAACCFVDDSTIAVGLDVVVSDQAAGAVEVIADGAAELLPKVGRALTGIATTEYGAIYLTLD